MMHAKKLRGFTILELIVVIAIIGILALILVPSMMGYIRDSRYRTANSNAKQVYTAALAYVKTYEDSPEDRDPPAHCDGIVNEWSGGKVTKMEDAVDSYMSGDAEGSCYYVSVDSDSYSVKYAMWSADETLSVIGYYPGANDPDNPVGRDGWGLDLPD